MGAVDTAIPSSSLPLSAVMIHELIPITRVSFSRYALQLVITSIFNPSRKVREQVVRFLLSRYGTTTRENVRIGQGALLKIRLSVKEYDMIDDNNSKCKNERERFFRTVLSPIFQQCS